MSLLVVRNLVVVVATIIQYAALFAVVGDATQQRFERTTGSQQLTLNPNVFIKSTDTVILIHDVTAYVNLHINVQNQQISTLSEGLQISIRNCKFNSLAIFSPDQAQNQRPLEAHSLSIEVVSTVTSSLRVFSPSTGSTFLGTFYDLNLIVYAPQNGNPTTGPVFFSSESRSFLGLTCVRCDIRLTGNSETPTPTVFQQLRFGVADSRLLMTLNETQVDLRSWSAHSYRVFLPSTDSMSTDDFEVSLNNFNFTFNGNNKLSTIVGTTSFVFGYSGNREQPQFSGKGRISFVDNLRIASFQWHPYSTSTTSSASLCYMFFVISSGAFSTTPDPGEEDSWMNQGRNGCDETTTTLAPSSLTTSPTTVLPMLTTTTTTGATTDRFLSTVVISQPEPVVTTATAPAFVTLSPLTPSTPAIPSSNVGEGLSSSTNAVFSPSSSSAFAVSGGDSKGDERSTEGAIGSGGSSTFQGDQRSAQSSRTSFVSMVKEEDSLSGGKIVTVGEEGDRGNGGAAIAARGNSNVDGVGGGAGSGNSIIFIISLTVAGIIVIILALALFRWRRHRGMTEEKRLGSEAESRDAVDIKCGKQGEGNQPSLEERVKSYKISEDDSESGEMERETDTTNSADFYQVNPLTRASFKKGKLLGSGGFGRVFSGYDLRTGGLAVMKEVTLAVVAASVDPTASDSDSQQKEAMQAMMEQLSREERRIAGLQREIDTLRKLSHPNIVSYFGVDKDKDYFYIFMELLPAGSLRQMLDKNYPVKKEKTMGGQTFIVSERVPMPLTMILKFLRDLLEGLVYLHSHGVVHRDIKADNLVIDDDGRLKLADFGCARSVDSIASVHGTPQWMAPEALKTGKGLSPAADIWAVGCTAIEMATSQRPFTWVGTTYKIMRSLLSEDALEKTLLDIPQEIKQYEPLHQFIMRCLTYDPHERPSAKDLLQDPLLSNPPPRKAGDRTQDENDNEEDVFSSV